MNRILLSLLVLALLCSSGSAAAAAPASSTRPAQVAGDEARWAKAHEGFVRHVTPIVKDVRTRLGDPKIGWARVTNALMRQYLPDRRLYVRDGAYNGQNMIWMVSVDGTISELGDGVWTSIGDTGVYTVEKVSAYIKGQKIKIENAEQAVEVARLFEFIQAAPSFVGMLRLNTQDYTLFDESFLGWMYGSGGNWKYTPTQAGTGWKVAKEYIGPPAAVQQPPTYELMLDENKQFVDLRRR